MPGGGGVISIEDISGLYEKDGSRKTSEGGEFKGVDEKGEFEGVTMTEGLLFSAGMMIKSSITLEVCLARIGTRTWLAS